MLVDRRHVLKSSLASAALTIVPSTLARSESGPEAVTLCLLGTKGGPSVRDINQLPFSNLLRIGSTSYIIDAGYGTTYRLIEKGIAAAANVKTLVLSHFVPGADAKINDEDWIAGIRKSFAGNVIVGRDRFEIAIN